MAGPSKTTGTHLYTAGTRESHVPHHRLPDCSFQPHFSSDHEPPLSLSCQPNTSLTALALASRNRTSKLQQLCCPHANTRKHSKCRASALPLIAVGHHTLQFLLLPVPAAAAAQRTPTCAAGDAAAAHLLRMQSQIQGASCAVCRGNCPGKNPSACSSAADARTARRSPWRLVERAEGDVAPRDLRIVRLTC